MFGEGICWFLWWHTGIVDVVTLCIPMPYISVCISTGWALMQHFWISTNFCEVKENKRSTNTIYSVAKIGSHSRSRYHIENCWIRVLNLTSITSVQHLTEFCVDVRISHASTSARMHGAQTYPRRRDSTVTGQASLGSQPGRFPRVKHERALGQRGYHTYMVKNRKVYKQTIKE